MFFTLCLCTDIRLELSSAEYEVSEGSEVVAFSILRCGSFEEEVLVSLTFSDITATGKWTV